MQDLQIKPKSLIHKLVASEIKESTFKDNVWTSQPTETNAV